MARWTALGLVALLLTSTASAAGLGTLSQITATEAAVPTTQPTPIQRVDGPAHPNEALARLMDDQDANRIRDSLDRKALEAPDSIVYLHLLYDRRPTGADARLLEDAFGASRTYVFRNWDWIKVETRAKDVAAMLGADGVVGIEEFVPPVLQNVVASQTTRVREAAAGIDDGYDHTQSLNEDLGLRGEGMVIAILDTGVDNTHEMLDDLDDDPATTDPKLVMKTDADGVTTIAGADASNGFVVVGCVDPIDDHFHGTHVAGTALGTTGGLTGLDTRGAAPQARLVDVDIAVPIGPGLAGVPCTPVGSAIGLGEDIAFDWIIDYNQGESCYGDPGADRIDVASMSFGAGGANPAITQNVGISDAVRAGMTFTLAAGNGGPNAQTLGGGADGAIIVAASDDRNTPTRNDDRLAGFSSRGPRPSDGDLDALDELRPDVAAPGVGISSALLHSGVGTVGASGTSMSTPHVAGVAALILQAADREGIDLRPVDKTGDWKDMGLPGAVPIRDILQKTAQYREQVEPGFAPIQQTATGRFGLPWNNGWGYGLVDAYGAVQLAIQDDEGGQARLRITAPQEGANVAAGPLLVQGSVDRTAGPTGLTADANGPYTATVDAPLSITGTATGASGPVSCEWTSAVGASIAAPEECATSVLYAAAGADTLTLTVHDGAETAQATADVSIVSGGVGALHLTSEVLAPATGCDGTPHYAMTPAPAAPGKAYAGLSGGAFGCSAEFQHTATQDAVMTGDVLVRLLIGCDVAGQAIEVDYEFFVGDTSVSGLVRPAVFYTCDAASDRFVYEQTFVADDATIRQGDLLRLQVNMFAAVAGLQGTPTENWHIKTGDAARPSGVFGAGLPQSQGGAPDPLQGTGPLSTDAVGTQTLYFHNAQTRVGNADNAVGTPTYMDGTAPTAEQPAVASNPRVRGVSPGTVWDPNWVHPGGLGLDDFDITITWYAETLGYGAALGDKWAIEVWVDDGDGVWTRNDAAANDENPDILAFTDDAVDNQAFFENGPDGVAKRTWTFRNLQATHPDGKLAIVLNGLFVDRDTATLVLYDSPEYPSGVTITHHESTQQLVAEAGGPYAGRAGAPIPLVGSFTGNDGAATCLWSSADDATFAAPEACSGTVTFASPGTKTVNVTVTDGSATASDAATVVVSSDDLGEHVAVFVDEEPEPRATVELMTAPDGAADWDVPIDLLGSSGAVRLTAVWRDADGTLLDSRSVNVTVDVAPPGATVTITNPTSDSNLLPPITFEGVYDTLAEPGGAPFGASRTGLGVLAQEAHDVARSDAPLRSRIDAMLLEAWARDADVQGMLGSPAYTSYVHRLSALPGFVAAVPTTSGAIVVGFSGQAPSDLPAAPEGWTVRAVSDVQATTLRAQVEPSRVKTVRADEWPNGPMSGPDGPHVPGETQSGAGPGSGLLVGDSGLCTASYLFEDVATGVYYLATAGHCIVNDEEDPATYTGRLNPDKVASKVQICVLDCTMNWAAGLPLQGTYITLEAGGDYHPVAFAKSGGLGKDFGLIEIPAQYNVFLRPWLSLWGGPKNFDRADAGDLLVHYGHGAYCCPVVGGVATRTPVDQGRAAVSIFGSRAEGFDAIGWASGGDSGSAVGTGAVRTDKTVVGLGGAGVLTHGVAIDHVPIFSGTDLEGGLDLAQPVLGFRPRLVTEDAQIRVADEPDTLEVAITSPADGATLDPAASPVAVTGTATFPLVPGAPGTQTATYYLHAARNPDCTNLVRWTNETLSPSLEGGSGCGSAFAAGGVALGAAVDFSYPAQPALTQDLLIDGTRPIVAELWMNGFVGEPVAVADIEVRLESGAAVLASGRANVMPAVDGRAVVALEALEPGVQAGEAFSVRVLIHHASPSGAFLRYGGVAPSHVRIPLATPAPRAVELSLDDASFAPESLLGVQGDVSWSSSWELAGVTEGEHTLYARAVQGASASSVRQVRVNVEASGPTPSFEAVVDALLLRVVDTSVAGAAPITAWAWDFGDGGTSTLQNSAHNYTQPGTYTVRLTVTDAAGRSRSASQDVSVDHAPWSLQVQMTHGQHTFLTWYEILRPSDGEEGAWSFDWTPDEAPEGAYLFEIRLLRRGTVAAEDSIVFHVQDPNQAPTAAFTAPSTASRGQAVSLSGGQSTDPDGTIESYSWDFGDGTVAQGADVTHTYSAIGDYVITLNVTDDDGASSTLSRTISVGNAAPNAVITGPDTVRKNRDATFSAASSEDPDGTTLTYAWDLGDGTTASTQSVTHRYKKDGEYQVRLTVTDADGASAEALHTIVVGK